MSSSEIFAADTEAGRKGDDPMNTTHLVSVKSCQLPEAVERYIEASNSHHVKSIVSCFSENAVVHDEGEEFNGQDQIEGWVSKTITNYNFTFNPIKMKRNDTLSTIEIEVSGTFDGSPITLDYHFTFKNNKIASLRIG